MLSNFVAHLLAAAVAAPDDGGSNAIFFLVGGAILVVFVTVYWLASRYRRCPSDKILVVYGRVGGAGSAGGGGLAAKCYHGGGAFVWPVIQDYAYVDLAPMPIDIKLVGALSQQNIRVNTPSTFTVGISTEPGVMENAAERVLGMNRQSIQELAKDIIFGQMRVVIATMPIEEINADRDKLIANISNGVEVELKKVGLRLINVNVQDITDESGYIEALGKDAAARALNDAKIKVAQKERDGEIGKAEADREKRVRVAAAQATAVEGENEAAVKVAQSNAARRQREAEATRLTDVAVKVKNAQALQEAYGAEEQAERQRAKKEEAAQTAAIVVPAEIEKRKIELYAEAEAERVRRTKKGEADGIRLVMEAQAEGLKAILSRKADGFQNIVQAAGGQASLASMLMVTEQLPQLVAEQVKAISNLKIGKVTVWDNGKGENGKTRTADFLSGLVGALPPLHELTRSVGIEMPNFLGRKMPEDTEAELEPAAAESVDKRQATVNELIGWAKQNVRSLSTFDENKDGKIGPADLAKVADTAIAWAQKSKEAGDHWFIGRGQTTEGPVPWSAIVAAAAKDPKIFVNLSDSSFWIPYEALALAMKRLGL